MYAFVISTRSAENEMGRSTISGAGAGPAGAGGAAQPAASRARRVRRSGGRRRIMVDCVRVREPPATAVRPRMYAVGGVRRKLWG